MRKTAACMNCGEVRGLAAHQLCYKCYRRHERAEDNKFAVRDRHSPGIHREHKKMFRGFTSVMVGLADLGAEARDVLAIRRLLEPYVAPIAKFLGPAPESEESKGPVNGEQNENLFTVHTGSARIKARGHDDDPGDDDSTGGNAG